MRFVLFVLTFVAAFTGPLAAQRIPAAFDTAAFRRHLEFLAADERMGRAPGTPGAAASARYIASHFARIGLTPGAPGYLQQVPLVGTLTRSPGSRVVFSTGEEVLAARFGTDIVAWNASADSVLDIAAQLVFVGYGIRAPEFGWDDYAGVSVAGKFVVVLVGDPPASFAEPALFDGSALTYYGRWSYKVEEARRQGAAGVLLVHSEEGAGYAWPVVQSSWGRETISLASEDHSGLLAWISSTFARRLLRAAGLSFDQYVARAASRDFVPVTSDISVDALLRSRVRLFNSANVIGILPGADSARAGEAIVYVSHYDHLGIGPAVDGDSIYNGAYDNASGVALLIELARAFARATPPRSIVFLATTAEEAGLLGAEYYVANPAVPIDSTIAVINIDGANLWGETDDIGVSGAERSFLADYVSSRLRSLDLRRAPDPAPERGYYFRADHFPFARAGVPAIDLKHGQLFRDQPPGWGMLLLDRYDNDHYHRPSDHIPAGMKLSGVAQQARFALLLGLDLARAPKQIR